MEIRNDRLKGMNYKEIGRKVKHAQTLKVGPVQRNDIGVVGRSTVFCGTNIGKDTRKRLCGRAQHRARIRAE